MVFNIREYGGLHLTSFYVPISLALSSAVALNMSLVKNKNKQTDILKGDRLFQLWLYLLVLNEETELLEQSSEIAVTVSVYV